MAARRFSELSASYQARFRSYARTHPELGKSPSEIWRSSRLRAAATGHAETPRSPAAALRDPERYAQYRERNYDALAALASTRAGQRAEAAYRERTTEAGGVPITIGAPPADDAMVRKTFMDAQGAVDYLADHPATAALVRQGMAWVVMVPRPGGGYDWQVWIYRVTP